MLVNPLTGQVLNSALPRRDTVGGLGKAAGQAVAIGALSRKSTGPSKAGKFKKIGPSMKTVGKVAGKVINPSNSPLGVLKRKMGV